MPDSMRRRSIAWATALIDGFARSGDASDATTASRLQTSVLADLPAELKRLKKLLLAQPISIDALPPEVVDRWVSADGRQLVEVQASEDLSDETAAVEFVSQVREIAPVVTGLPVVYVEAKKICCGSVSAGLHVRPGDRDHRVGDFFCAAR